MKRKRWKISNMKRRRSRKIKRKGKRKGEEKRKTVER